MSDDITSNQQQKRDLVEMIARQVQNHPNAMSAALSLGSLANIAKIGSDVIGGFEDVFGCVSVQHPLILVSCSHTCLICSDDSQQNKRAVLPVPAGATPAASAVPSSTSTAKFVLPTTASGAIDIGSIIETAASFLPLFFKREELELMARE